MNAIDTHCKIVYYGPRLSGKTTNLAFIHRKAPDTSRGELVTLSTETEGGVTYDFLPLNIGVIHGRRTRFHLYTVPGDPSQRSVRETLLNGVDGVVFVADSSRSRLKDNVESFCEAQRILKAMGKSFDEIPLVIQFNKQDLPDAAPVSVLNARINSINAPHFGATADKGSGVLSTLRAISELILAKLERGEYEGNNKRI